MDKISIGKIYRGIINGYNKEKRLVGGEDVELMRSIALEVQKILEEKVVEAIVDPKNIIYSRFEIIDL